MQHSGWRCAYQLTTQPQRTTSVHDIRPNATDDNPTNTQRLNSNTHDMVATTMVQKNTRSLTSDDGTHELIQEATELKDRQYEDAVSIMVACRDAKTADQIDMHSDHKGSDCQNQATNRPQISKTKRSKYKKAKKLSQHISSGVGTRSTPTKHTRSKPSTRPNPTRRPTKQH